MSAGQRPRPVPVLAESTLSLLPNRIDVPAYDRTALLPGVVHFGVGGFHRAHQAAYLDSIARQGISLSWGIVGVGLRSGREKRALIRPQQGLYTLSETSPAGEHTRVIGSLTSYLCAHDDTRSILGQLASPLTKLVTITVTGAGYKVEAGSGDLDTADREVVQDLTEPGRPVTLPGYLVEALRLRREAKVAPFTVLSCDNLPSNGETTRRVTASLARLHDDSLADWIEANVAFPGSVVDRITPQTSAADQRRLTKELGVRDRWPVIAEPYQQWTIEDSFSDERPPLDRVGAEFVGDVTTHELVKKRLLNGGHCAIAYAAHLRGFERVDEAVRDPSLARYLRSLLVREVVPLLPRPTGLDLISYVDDLLRRFANPGVADRIARLCERGSTKMPAYLIPSLEEALLRGAPHRNLTTALAAWIRYLQGLDACGRPYSIPDARANLLQPLARRARHDPRPLLGVRSVFGDLGRCELFVAELRAALDDVDRARQQPTPALAAAA